MKPKLHIHSDCYKWGGSENMVGIFLQDPTINEIFKLSFSYRYTPRYEEGMRKWVPNAGDLTYDLENPIYPLRLPITQIYKIRPYFKPIMALGYASAVVDIVKMTKLFRRINPDILHINNGGYPGATSCNSAAIAGRMAGIPKITYMVTSTTRDPWWCWPMTWEVKKAVTTFISASQYLRDHSRHLWKNGTNLGWETISNTVIPRTTMKRKVLRDQFDIADSEVVFLCIGDLVERKGFYRAIDAFSEIKEQGTPRSLWIVGQGPEEDFLRTRMKQKKSGIYRFYNGSDIHPYSFINACDILVVPSMGDEDWPNVILIALMMGKPVIISNIGGLPEMIEHRKEGFVFRSDDELRIYMEVLLGKERRIIMGGKAQAIFEQKYKLEKIIKRYLGLWND